MYRLVYLTGKFKGKRLTVTEPSVVAGRDEACGVVLPDDEASRQHATFEEREDGIYVHDMGSTNEVIVNGEPVKEMKLDSGDKIELGQTILQFQPAAAAVTQTHRKTSKTQGITAAAVFLIIVGQILFLAFLALRHKDVITVPEKDPSPPPIEELPLTFEEPIPDESETLAEAEAHLREREREQAERDAKPKEPVPEPMAGDIEQLRAEVDNLRQQVEGLSEEEIEAERVAREAARAPEPKPEPTEKEVAARPAPEEPPPPARPVDPLVRRARDMLKEAGRQIQLSNFADADKQLARIQLMAPDFLPAYIERARLFERRGMLRQAGEQWTEVLNRSMGTPLYEEAAAERIRLAREQTLRKTTSSSEERRGARPSGRLPRRIRIVDIQRERFPENDQFEEMRLLRMTLKPKSNERNVDSYQVDIVVTFFDENTETHELVPTRAVVPKDALRVDGEWLQNEEKVVTAAYIVPQGFRKEEKAKYDQNMIYYGYVVQVYYRQELQDAEARPKDLLNEMDRIPSPFHDG